MVALSLSSPLLAADTTVSPPSCLAESGLTFTALTFNSIVPADTLATEYILPNAAIVNGQSIDVLVSLDGLPTNEFTDPAKAFPRVSSQAFAFNINVDRTITYTFVESGTTNPVNISARVRTTDVDQLEAVRTATASLAGIATNDPTNLTASTIGNQTQIQGMANNRSTVEEDIVEFIFVNSSTITLTYDSTSKNSGFNFDGADLNPLSNEQCFVKSLDWGDAPTDMSTVDASLTSTYGNAFHVIDPTVYLGSSVDGDPSSQNVGLLADGDDTDGNNDDDGVSFEQLGSANVLRVDETNIYTVDASKDGFLNAWVDWNQDGDWDDVGEAIATNTPLSAGNNMLTVAVSPNAPQGVTYARFRYTTDLVTTPSPLGLLNNGEVEDYAVHLLNPTPIDVCNTVVTNGYFENGPFPANYTFTPEFGVEGWATIPADPTEGNSFNTRNTMEIWRSGFNNTPSFEGNYHAELNAHVAGMLYQDVSLAPGSSYSWKLAHRGRGTTNTMNIYMGAPGAEVLQRTVSTGPSAWVQYTGTYTVPLGEYITRFGFQSASGGGSGNFLDAISIPGGCDYGDAPDSYKTLRSSNGAHHITSSLLTLGDEVGDPDADGQPSLLADADDNDTYADEDGILSFDTLTSIDSSYSIDVTYTNNIGLPANLAGWIDFNNNGSFDPQEYATTSVASGISSGTVTLSWTNIPADIQAAETYLRLRLSSDTLNSQDYEGKKSNGEVEDHLITIINPSISGRVYVDSNSSSTADPSEKGISGTVVVLRSVTTGQCLSVQTDADGHYQFNRLPDDDYELYQAHGESTPTPISCGTGEINNPPAYRSTSADALLVTMQRAPIVNQNFGEVPNNTFEPNHQSVITPSSFALYPHTFKAGADGEVSFTASHTLSVTNGWGSALYNDQNCNGLLDAGEASTEIDGAVMNIAGSEKICLINKVFAPATVIPQENHLLTITAEFTYPDGFTPATPLTVSDLTVATQSGGSSLKLVKSVENTTQGTAESTTTNNGKSGDRLKYRIRYTNIGTAALSNVLVNDEIPAFTEYVFDSVRCETTASSMSCNASVAGTSVTWNIAGQLLGGESGQVSYEVQID